MNGVRWSDLLRPAAWLNALTPRRRLRRLQGLAYGQHPRQRLDVYLPHPAPAAGARALVVFLYGGSWQAGTRADYLFVGEALASRGCVVVVPDYRVYPEVVFPGFVDDAAAALSWAREHAPRFGVDPARLFLMGHSAGAQIATLLATDDAYLRTRGLGRQAIAGVIGLGGAYDFLPLRDPVLRRVFPADLRRRSQPVHCVQGAEPPMLLLVSTDDRVVDPGNTERLAARLQAVGSRVRVLRYRRLGHMLILGVLGTTLRALAPVLREISDFIDEHAPADPPAPLRSP